MLKGTLCFLVVVLEEGLGDGRCQVDRGARCSDCHGATSDREQACKRVCSRPRYEERVGVVVIHKERTIRGSGQDAVHAPCMRRELGDW